MKKWTTLVLAALMLVGIVSCAAADTLSYTVFQQGDDVPNPVEAYEVSGVIRYWQDMFDIDMEWQIPPQGSEAEQMNLMLGTGDYTDIMDMSFNTESLSTLCDDGSIYDLTPYLDTLMPNYKAYLDANPDVKSALFDDTGRIYLVAIVQENPKQWGGLVYCRDILETMTGGNVAFPSGSEQPATIEDWEYMLDLMTQYFKAAGMTDYAGLILPATGYFSTGELISGFGIGGTDYVKADGTVGFGIAEDNFYNYLVKMKEWYEKGYIYADFASRSQDLFYLPNTALTYGGAAGVWFGLVQQLGGTMSLPEYGLNMNVLPIGAPADTANGVTAPIGTYLAATRATTNSGWAISTACSQEKLERILPALDWFFTPEGAATRSMGLSAEQGAANYEEYGEKGCPNGARENGSILWTAEMNTNTELGQYEFSQNRLPGLVVDYATRTCELSADGVDYTALGHQTWTQFGNSAVYPYVVAFTPDEMETVNRLSTNLQDYAHPMIVNFIMGREELTPESFAAYQQKLHDLGLDEYLTIKQAALDRFNARAAK